MGSQANQISLSHQQSAILPIHYIAEQVGTPVDAIFGSNIFLHYTITVDYERQQLTFASPVSGAALSGTAIPVQLVSNTPFVEASIEGEDGKKVTGLFLVDSGTTGAMILNKKFLEAHPGLISTNHFVETPTVTAVGGRIVSKRVRVPHLGVGPFLFSSVVASRPRD